MPIVVLIVATISFIVTYITTPFVIKRMQMRGLTGKDMNKVGMPEVSELGGISVMFGFCSGIIAALFIFTYTKLISFDLTILLAGFTTIIMVGFIGIFDDIIGWRTGIRQWQHALFPLFAALPLMALNVGTKEMYIPFFGLISFGIFYSLVLVPIGVTGATNAFNMLAGLNGLEAGMGILINGSLMLVAWTYGNTEAIIILAAILGALSAFIRFNWYPAKIFPGDSLTMMVGATIAVAAIIGNMEKIAILMMALYFVELGFKAKHKFQSQCFGIPQPDGTLKADPRGGSLTQWVMRRGKFTEKEVVLIILGMQTIVCITVIILSLFKLMWVVG